MQKKAFGLTDEAHTQVDGTIYVHIYTTRIEYTPLV